MQIVDPTIQILDELDGPAMLKRIEQVARTCYKSENLIKEDSCNKFVKNLINSKHEAMLEFVDITVKFTCDRGVSHEIVRHRVASYAQESTRYANYSNEKFGSEITVVKPSFWNKEDSYGMYDMWKEQCEKAEHIYMTMLSHGAKPQEARSILPNSLKTEINMKCNLREWRHFFNLRCDKAAHPDMRHLATMLLIEFHNNIPVIFDDIYEKFCGQNN